MKIVYKTFRRKTLRKNEIEAILEEIPVDNAFLTEDESSDDSDVEELYDNVAKEFDVPPQNLENDENTPLIPETQEQQQEENPNLFKRTWKKRDVSTSIVPFEMTEGPVIGIFENMKT